MSDSTAEFRLGIIGGCMSHQQGISISDLYHQRLAKIVENRLGVRLRIKIARNFEAGHCERLLDLVKCSHIDGVLLHVRGAFRRKIDLLAAYTAKAETRYVINPALFNRKRIDWAELEAKSFCGSAVLVRRRHPVAGKGTTQNNFPPAIRFCGLRIGELNRAIGILLGLDRWVVRDELRLLAQFRHCCDEKCMPFVVLGPTPVSDSFRDDYIFQKMNNSLRKQAMEMNVPFCSLEGRTGAFNHSLQLRDDIHLTREGHQFVANALYPVVEPWITGIMGCK